MKPFWALRVHDSDASDKGHPYATLQQVTLEELSEGTVTIEVHYSSVNYKDALAATGTGRILKKFPLNAGIDASGVVLESRDPRFSKGQQVLVNGCGIGENFDGGYSEVLRVNGNSVVPLPKGLTMREAMILGTAGFTAALALHRMLENHQSPDKGPILITGASGGVGTIATQLFAAQGFEVHAVSQKPEAVKNLLKFGAKKVIPPNELNLGSRPLESVRWGGVVDNVGGSLLSHAMAHVQLWGNICCIGLAESAELKATVIPLILRGVSLLGVSSNNCPMDLRQKLWNRLATDWRPPYLNESLSRTVDLNNLMMVLDDLIHRRVSGRVLVEIRKDGV
ncbi:MAG: YhdH/YhfP family quinone oxidoreductase [Bdellovibrionales bacterium]